MHTKIKRLLLLVLALTLLFGVAGQAVPKLHGLRKEYDLTNEPVKGLSPQLALATQALAWGRGIIIDVIWIRMEALKREGRYFELVQLAKWACDLAPNIPEVWDMQAWNMAYNISCQIDDLPDRWRWVWSGIELLRDQGIPNNPNSFQLYQSLAWTIFHKIGEQDDYAHPFYKQKLATLMQEVLGGGGDEATLKALAAAPYGKNGRQELLKDPDVKRFVDQCAADGFDIIDGFFQTLYQTPSVPDKVLDLVYKPENASAMTKVADFARARRLREDYKMDPQLMLDLRDEYKDNEGRPAPFDWRSPSPTPSTGPPSACTSWTTSWPGCTTRPTSSASRCLPAPAAARATPSARSRSTPSRGRNSSGPSTIPCRAWSTTAACSSTCRAGSCSTTAPTTALRTLPCRCSRRT